MEPDLATAVVRLLEDDAPVAGQTGPPENFGGERGERLLRYYKLFRSLADDLEGEVDGSQVRAEVMSGPSTPRDRSCLIEIFHPRLRYVRKNYMPPEIYAYMARILYRRGIEIPPAPAFD